jgi:sulfur transfer protein SufE
MFWKEKNIRLQSEQKDIIDQINKLKTQEAKYFELGINILELARKAKTIYKNEERTAEKNVCCSSQFSRI